MKRCLACRETFSATGWRCPHCGWQPREDGHVSFTAAEPGSAFDAGLVELIAGIEDVNFWFHARRELILWALGTYFPRAGTFFEVGCGTGHVLAGIRAARAEVELTGGEPSRAALAIASRRLPGVPLLQLDARALPFAAEFDVVGAFDVLEHVEEDDAALMQMRDAIRPGGGLLLSAPQHPALWGVMDEIGGHVRRYTRRELVSKIAAAGFRPRRVTSFVSLLLPALYISRLRLRSRQLTLDSELSLPRVVDHTLRGVMAVERALIRHGVSFPAGGSLLVVADRA